MLSDLFLLIGVAAMGAGVYLAGGLPYLLIAVGLVLVLLAFALTGE